MQVDDVGILRKGHHNIGHSRADVPDHNTADDKDAHALYAAGYRQHKRHRRKRPGKGSKNQGQ